MPKHPPFSPTPLATGSGGLRPTRHNAPLGVRACPYGRLDAAFIHAVDCYLFKGVARGRESTRTACPYGGSCRAATVGGHASPPLVALLLRSAPIRPQRFARLPESRGTRGPARSTRASSSHLASSGRTHAIEGTSSPSRAPRPTPAKTGQSRPKPAKAGHGQTPHPVSVPAPEIIAQEPPLRRTPCRGRPRCLHPNPSPRAGGAVTARLRKRAVSSVHQEMSATPLPFVAARRTKPDMF
jgi:hypothetical protein